MKKIKIIIKKIGVGELALFATFVVGVILFIAINCGTIVTCEHKDTICSIIASAVATLLGLTAASYVFLLNYLKNYDDRIEIYRDTIKIYKKNA